MRETAVKLIHTVSRTLSVVSFTTATKCSGVFDGDVLMGGVSRVVAFVTNDSSFFTKIGSLTTVNILPFEPKLYHSGNSICNQYTNFLSVGEGSGAGIVTISDESVIVQEYIVSSNIFSVFSFLWRAIEVPSGNQDRSRLFRSHQNLKIDLVGATISCAAGACTRANLSTAVIHGETEILATLS